MPGDHQALQGIKSYFEQTYRDWLKERMADKDDTFGFEDENKFETKLKDTGVYDGDNDAYRNMYEYIFTINTMHPETVMETISVPNIPLNLWTHVVLRCINHKVDVYVSRRIKKRTVLGGLSAELWRHLRRRVYQDAGVADASCTAK